MGATYTRQSTYSDGDVITAAHTNDEFNQLLAAFAASTGHTHDGTTAEGGPITKLLGTSLTFGDGTAGTDITVTFDGESNDGVLKWMEDEDYFEFSDDILVASTEKLQFRDTAIYLNSSTDGQLDIVADTEVQIAATTIDINGNADISGNLDIGGNLTVTGTTTFNGGTLTLGDADTDNIVFGGEVDSDIIPDDDNTHDLGSSSKQWKDIYINGTAYLDAIDFNGTAISATAAELNIIDGDTTATSTTLADADRVVVNDAGTMKQVALTDFETYFESALDTLSNVTTVGALNSGSITSGFGTIDTGSSTITTTGLITGGSLDIDDVVINGSTIGHTDDTDLITVANGIATVAGEISVTTLDIGGTNVTSTATELNIVDGGTSATSTTLADADRVVVNDNGTMVQVALTDFETYFESALDTLSNVTTVGALNSGSITSGFGSINNGSSAITTTGTITYGSLSDGSITITAFVDEDNMASNSATLVPTQQSVKAYVDTQLTAEDLDVTTDSGTIDIDLDSETLTIAGGEGIDTSATGTTVTIAGEDASTSNKGVASFSDTFFSVSSGAVSLDAAQTGITSVVNSSLELGRDADNRIKFGTDNQIIFEVDGGDNVIFKASGEIEATSLDISGDADIDGTLEADAITVNGTALNTVIAGVTVTNATTAAVATTVTISDNESTNEENAVVFTAGGDVDGGNIGLESDGDLTYNPSTGTISATVFKGNIDAVDGDFDGTLEADAITVGGTALNTVIAGVTVTNATNSAHVLVTDNESTNEENLITFVEDATSSTGNVGLEMDGHLTYNPSTGTVTATVFKGNIDAVDGDFDGTLEADAITVNGTALNTVIADEATALAIALG